MPRTVPTGKLKQELEQRVIEHMDCARDLLDKPRKSPQDRELGIMHCHKGLVLIDLHNTLFNEPMELFIEL